MKKITYYVAVAIVAMVAYSCNNATSPQDNEESTEEVVEHEEHADHEEDEDAIVLINGEKWEVNAEMKPFIKNGENLVNSFLANPAPTEQDYQVLAMQLKEQNDKLIKSCTMQGQSHDELHKWLHPHLDLVKKLSSSIDGNLSKQIVTQLSQSYNNFGKYFQ